ncbi:MAG: DEAD/DEAH box helicase [Candidatus Nanopelagicales bacterium]|nr:DEAD/DEAH box helicase [Candidatus Nanopelagicales bacterium]MDZ4248851.1 DEAD/DEAH box helicase [Candidatus Nanopelagicales bacterium]
MTESPSTTSDTKIQPTFRELGVLEQTARALADDGIERTFPIQSMALPLALAGGDIIGQAKTGTGKTLGFGVPLLQRIAAPGEEGSTGVPQALVVVPTRELAIQVGKDIERAGRYRRVRVITIYGGRAYEPQIEALVKGIEVVVGTPGRLIDLVGQGHLNLREVRVLVLDEADEMLDMGFLPDVEKIVAEIPEARQTMLFSATMPGKIVALAKSYMERPTHMRSHEDGDSATVDATEQHVWRAHPMDKMEIIARVLQADDRGLTLIFSRTKRRVQRIADDLVDRGFAAAAIHGDLGQGAREQAMRAFRHGKIDVLAATDVAARGIDVEGITHVINYECPDDEKTYIHRIGRTGRAGSSGVAVTMVDWADVARWQMIDRALKLPFAEPLETYSSSDHIYAGLGIPRSAVGTLPRSARVRKGLAAEELEDIGETGVAGGRARKGSRPPRGRNNSRPPAKGGARDGGGGSREPAASAEGGQAGKRRRPRRRRRVGSGEPTRQVNS